MTRRGLIGWFLGLCGIAAAQQVAVMEKGKAVVCDPGVQIVECPFGHKTCKKVDAPLAIGNDNRSYPDTAQLFDYRISVCDVCGIVWSPR